MSAQSSDQSNIITIAEAGDYLNHFQHLERGISRLEKLGTPLHAPKGTVLNKVKKIPDHCYILKSGRVVSYEYKHTGDERIYNFMEAGSLFLEECLLYDKACPVLFRTTEDSELMAITKCELKHAFKNDLDVVLDVLESVSMKYLSSMEVARLDSYQNASWQICRFFMMTEAHYSSQASAAMRKKLKSDTAVKLERKFSHQTIAELLGLNRVTVTRKINELQKKGLIAKVDGYYYIIDPGRMIRYMDAVQYQK